MAVKLEVHARAKINLTLDVLGKRADGYHEVEMIMQTISLADVLTLERIPGEIILTCHHPDLAIDQTNLAFRAAAALQQYTGTKLGAHIHLDKQIPIEAGLAGGSTDAAAVLRGLNQLWELGLSVEQLYAIGATLGSDVPFCISGGTALATGRGEQITPVQLAPEMYLVLVKPPFGVSTAQVYQNFNSERVKARPQTRQMLAALTAGDREAIIGLACNTLESVTLELYPRVAELKVRLSQAGAKGVLMSGSGPTVFGFVPSLEIGHRIAAELTDLGRTFVVSTCEA